MLLKITSAHVMFTKTLRLHYDPYSNLQDAKDKDLSAIMEYVDGSGNPSKDTAFELKVTLER